MAMTKAERAALQSERDRAAEAEKSLAAARALGWPRVPRPTPVNVRDEMGDDLMGRLLVGWYVWVRPGGTEWRVGLGCSSGVGHAHDRTDRTTSQGPGVFFRTRAEALAEVRWRLCLGFADALAGVDEAAELERSHPSLVVAEVKSAEEV